jgi:hypothetical protein
MASNPQSLVKYNNPILVNTKDANGKVSQCRGCVYR